MNKKELTTKTISDLSHNYGVSVERVYKIIESDRNNLDLFGAYLNRQLNYFQLMTGIRR